MGDYGIKISKPGSNVLTAENKNLVYSSGFNSLKVAEKGHVVSTASPHEIAHSLAYKPLFLVYVKDSSANGGYVIPESVLNYSYADETKLYVPVSTIGDEISYLIFYDPIDTGITNYTRTKTADFGVKVSQSGSVYTASDTELSFMSEYQTLQIRDIYEVAGPTAGNTVTVTHSYGYPPAFICNWHHGTTYQTLPYYLDFGGGINVLYGESKTNTLDIVSAADYNASGDTIQVILFTEDLES